MSRLPPRWLLRSLSMVALLAATAPTALAADALRVVEDASTVSVLDGQRLVFRYRYGDVPMKPYADFMASPGGVQILRDSPSDHKHHHGLMFALAADAIDFWSEKPQCGKQVSDTPPTLLDVPTSNGGRRAGFLQNLNWVGPGASGPAVVEQRAVAVIDAADLGATLVDWSSRLTPPEGKSSVPLSGAHFFGLGMRFVTSMDKDGRFFNAEDKDGPIVRGDERVTPVKWCAYTAKADGHPVTVALFDAATNARHPATIFTMYTPFAYLAATLNLWKEPMTLEADKPLDLHYGVALWDGAVDHATVEKLYQRWATADWK